MAAKHSSRTKFGGPGLTLEPVGRQSHQSLRATPRAAPPAGGTGPGRVSFPGRMEITLFLYFLRKNKRLTIITCLLGLRALPPAPNLPHLQHSGQKLLFEVRFVFSVEL